VSVVVMVCVIIRKGSTVRRHAEGGTRKAQP
jgi:hypothetical protein